ncbi:hypothetical protein EDC04DRAFT_2802819 [Pisolithus marmoratus]|nr:hypothetical protein EDC04DRAFT_2802819 [Pisolithus marmoratus]
MWILSQLLLSRASGSATLQVYVCFTVVTTSQLTEPCATTPACKEVYRFHISGTLRRADCVWMPDISWYTLKYTSLAMGCIVATKTAMEYANRGIGEQAQGGT